MVNSRRFGEFAPSDAASDAASDVASDVASDAASDAASDVRRGCRVRTRIIRKGKSHDFPILVKKP